MYRFLPGRLSMLRRIQQLLDSMLPSRVVT
jgi:hypothetical protein